MILELVVVVILTDMFATAIRLFILVKIRIEIIPFVVGMAVLA